VTGQITVARQPAREPTAVPGPWLRLMPRRLLWLALALITLGLPLLSKPGSYIADSRDAVWFDPWTYLSHSLRIWQSSPFLGHQQHEGIIVPMTLVIGLLRSIGLPMWAAQRVWHGLLLFLAAGGMVLLIDELRRRRTIVAAGAAALFYTLTPYTFGYGLSTSAAYIPYALLPLLMVVTIRWLPRRGLFGPALLGLTVFFMGGGNGGPQAYALLPALAYVGWEALALRAVPLGQAARFVGLSLAFVVGLNGYWIFLLTSPEISNAFSYTEKAPVINKLSSFSESVRGLGFWQFYGRNQFGPWVGNVSDFIRSPLLVVVGFLVPTAAIVSAWLVRWRLRLFFVFLLIVSVLVMAGIFPVSSPSPFGHFLLFSYDHITGAQGLRTTYKMGMALSLSIAVLLGIGLDEAVRIGTARPRFAVGTIALGIATFLVLMTVAWPLWTGHLYTGLRSAPEPPDYWKRALSFMEDRSDGYRAYFAPGELFGIYRWGALNDALADATPSLSTVRYQPVPIGEGYGTNLVAAVEQSSQQGRRSEQAAVLFRYLGVRNVVLQNDIDWQRSGTARPAEMQSLARDPSLQSLASFGFPGQNMSSPGLPGEGDGDAANIEARLPPVQILAVPDPSPVVRAEALPPVVVSGDGFGIASLGKLGLLDGNPPVLYSGDLSDREIRRLTSQGAMFVITDTNRRREWSFSTASNSFSETMPVDAPIPADRRFNLFADRPATQTVASYRGVQAISAFTPSSLLGPQPQYRAANAFDGDPNTTWITGTFANPIGSWVQVSFEHPLILSDIALSIPDLGLGRRVSSARLILSDGTSVLTTVSPGTTRVHFPAHRSSFLRVQVTGITRALYGNGVGFSEIAIPGVRAREVLSVPTDVVDALRSVPSSSGLAYVFDRARTSGSFAADEEVRLARMFQVPTDRAFELGGRVRLDPSASDEAIDRALLGTTAAEVSSSSRVLGGARVRGSAAFDGRSDTAWRPSGGVGEWVRIKFPERVTGRVNLRALVPPFGASISQVRVSLSDGHRFRVRVDPDTGRAFLSFRPRPVSEVKVTITRLRPSVGPQSPIGILSIRIGGVDPLRIDPASSPPCSSESLAVDGIPVPIRARGSIGQLLNGEDVPMVACGEASLVLHSGPHELDMNGPLQGQAASLVSAVSEPLSQPQSPNLRVRSRADGYDVQVIDARDPFYLVIGQTASRGWKAAIDGAPLGRVQVLDGYSAGWRVNEEGSYVISVRYGAQRAYLMWLAVAGLTFLIAFGVVLRHLVRFRRP
jgi:arabinofuranan 3-O-arabinosyltransferase